MSQTTESAGTRGSADTAPGDRLGGKYMTFKLADEEYGLGILQVRDVIGLVPITRVPRTREYIRGVINLRGAVIPVVDVRQKFGLQPTALTDQTVIIVVQIEAAAGETTMGILVDEVLEVRDIARDCIEPTPNFGVEELDTDFILGIGKHGDRVIFLLDIGKVLTGDELREAAEPLRA